MLLPEKHIKLSESILGLGAFVLQDLETPKTIDNIWKDFEKVNNSPQFPAYHGFDNLVLALDFLFSIGAISQLSDGKIKVQNETN
jgi:hypothetical protein